MPIDIEILRSQGEDVAMVREKKVDLNELEELLRQQGYTVEELAEYFGVKPNTIRSKFHKLRKEKGLKVVAKRLEGKTYYFIE